MSTPGFLDLEPLIIERLRAVVTDAKAVYAAEDLADVEERSQTTPALHVIYGGYRVLQASALGTTATTEQTWIVVAAVRGARQGPNALAKSRASAGALLQGTLRALMGWSPIPRGMPLMIANGPAPRFREGLAYFPLAFTATWPISNT